MNRGEIEKLLGGYGTGTLTSEEERALFAAALEDQALFDALAREESLRDLLGDPSVRSRLLAALADQPAPWYRDIAGWAARPRVWAALAGILCLAVPLAIWQTRHRRPQPVLVAHLESVEAPRPKAVLENAPATPPPPAKARPSAAVRRPRRQAPPSTGPSPQPENLTAPPAAPEFSAVNQVKPDKVETIDRPSRNSATSVATLQMSPAGSVPPAAQPAPVPQAKQAQVQGSLRAAAPLMGQVSPLRWSVLRRQPDGDFVAADPAGLQAGDAVKLRLESASAGYVYVLDGERVLASSGIEPGKPFDAPIEPQGVGRRQFEAWFSPTKVVWTSPAGAGRNSAGLAGFGGGGGGAAPARPVPISITLTYK